MAIPPTDAMPSRQVLTAVFSSLGNSHWKLLRTLRSSNPLDLNGELRGTASFTALPPLPPPDSSPSSDSFSSPSHREWLYCEEGEVPTTAAVGGTGVAQPGLRWTKKYIWRLGSETGRISVWFVKVAPGPEEADYLFHDFDFGSSKAAEGQDPPATPSDNTEKKEEFVIPPTPPHTTLPGPDTAVLAARGNHLCINDMYRTAYAFRVRPVTGEVLSWATRHVVRGPKKDQEIVNLYERG